MDLDFKTVRALSSPTRIRILDRVLEQESTPTSLAEEVDRSKSTISSHLDTLLDAGLVEKDEEEGRKRVVYEPTAKARAIVEGRERKVRFSLTSSIVSGFAGLTLLGYSWLDFAQNTAMKAQSADAAALSGEAAAGGAEPVAQSPSALEPATAVLAAGLFFLAVSVLGLLYGLAMRRLG